MGQENLFDDVTYFKVFDNDVGLISTETSYGWQTVADFGGTYYYMDDQLITLETAINAWQEYYDIELTQGEIEYILIENA